MRTDMRTTDKELLISFIRPYPRAIGLTALAFRYWKARTGRDLFTVRDGHRVREARLARARASTRHLLARVTRDDPSLLMELRLPLQEASAEFYRTWKLDEPGSETYYSLCPASGQEGGGNGDS